MRFDGYYILSDLTEVPNLRGRSARFVTDVLKRLVLRVPVTSEPADWRLRTLLFTFGVAATLYRMVLLLAIAAILASKMFVVGMALAVFYLGSTVVTTLRKLTRYLWHAEETAAIRGRAIAVSLLALVALPTALVLAPVPAHVNAVGLLTTEHETVVRAKADGFLQEVAVEGGQHLHEGDLLVDLANDVYLEDIAGNRANLRAAEIRREAYRIDEPDRALQEEHRAEAYRLALRQSRGRFADLQVRAPESGRVVNCLRENDIGSFIEEGTPVATIVSGRWRVRSILTEEDLISAAPRVGEAVQFRARGGPSQTVDGVIVRITPGGSHAISLSPLTHLGGGDIAVNPETGEASEPYFELTIDLENPPPDGTLSFRHGMTGYVRLNASAEPVATTVYRRLSRFVNRLMQE